MGQKPMEVSTWTAMRVSLQEKESKTLFGENFNPTLSLQFSLQFFFSIPLQMLKTLSVYLWVKKKLNIRIVTCYRFMPHNEKVLGHVLQILYAKIPQVSYLVFCTYF